MSDGFGVVIQEEKTVVAVFCEMRVIEKAGTVRVESTELTRIVSPMMVPQLEQTR